MAAKVEAVSNLTWNRILIPVGSGVLLVLVPTVFTVFPGLAQWPVVGRVGIIIAWLFVAVAGAYLTVFADDSLRDSVAKERKSAEMTEHRAMLRDHFLRVLQRSIGGIPDQYELTLYGPNPDGRFLIPLYPPAVSLEDTAIFRCDAGAIGWAWTRGQPGVLVVKGPEVSGPGHNLEAVQRHRYSPYQMAVATVIFDQGDEKIGVLCAMGRDDDGFFDQSEGTQALQALAKSVAWIVPEALLWMQPSELEVS